MPGDGFQEQLGRIELETDVFRPAQRQVWVVIRVVSDLVAFRQDSPDQARIFLGVCAHEKEGSFDVLLLQDVENLRGPFWIRAIVKSQGYLMGCARALMIKRRKLRELRIRSGEITLLICR